MSGRQTSRAAVAAALVVRALEIWLRYIVPLTALSAVALAPVLAIALRVRAPADRASADAVLTLGWELLALAIFGQLALVGGAAAVVRGEPSQLRALTSGLRGLVRAAIPCAAALCVVAIGSLALVVPGIALLALLSLTGASPAQGVPAVLLDSAAAARKHLLAVVLAALALVALDVAIPLVAQRAVVGAWPRPPTAAQLAAVRSFIRAVALALVIASPLPAVLLALIRSGYFWQLPPRQT